MKAKMLAALLVVGQSSCFIAEKRITTSDLPFVEQNNIPKQEEPHIAYQLPQVHVIPADGLEGITAYYYFQIHGKLFVSPTEDTVNCQFGMYREIEKLYQIKALSAVFFEGKEKGASLKEWWPNADVALQDHFHYLWEGYGHTSPSDDVLYDMMHEGIYYGIDFLVPAYKDMQNFYMTGWEDKKTFQEQSSLVEIGIPNISSILSSQYKEMERKRAELRALLKNKETENTVTYIERLYAITDELDSLYVAVDLTVEEAKRLKKDFAELTDKRTRYAWNNSLEQAQHWFAEQSAAPKGYAVIIGSWHMTFQDGRTFVDYVLEQKPRPKVVMYECPEI